uniref:nicotinate phosphoribosyltransferase n=1 Tax=Anopheles minimus TaxID=112268 RepID=A0A182VTQ5_9DIPT
GFDGTSNVLAGKLFNIPVKGTHAHAYITSFTGIDELKTRVLQHKEDATSRDLLELAMEHRAAIASVLDVSTDESSEGELAAMVSFAIAFPDGFMALVDTYDVKSLCVYLTKVNRAYNKHYSCSLLFYNCAVLCAYKPSRVSDKLLGEPADELSDPTDSVVCESTCLGRLHDQEEEESMHQSNIITNTLPEIPEEECNGCCAEDEETRCPQHAEPEEEKALEEETADEENNEQESAEPDESCHDPPPSITVEDEESAPVLDSELTVKESDENGNEDIEDQNVLKATDEGEESVEVEAQNETEALDGVDENTRCANCEALNTMIHHLKSVGKSFRSGLLNFCAVALALNDQGYRAIGIRIDSGDLAYLSCLARETFERIAERFKLPWFSKLTIVASNDINEDTILSLNEQGHKIDCFGIGTHLVTCQRQPALGCVYKMVEINNQPRIKLSQDVGKVTMPGSKNVFRLYGADGHALIDLLQRVDENPPEVGQKVLCRHPFQESKRAYVIPTQVEPLYRVYWSEGRVAQVLPSLEEVRERVQASLKTLRQDHKRTLNPTPYKVAVSDNLYNFIHELWLQNAPIGELS